jgi:RNA polymerase sigma factor (sigma-70 family)
MTKSLKELSDEELMQEYRLGDFGALDELYSRHAATVYGFLQKRLGNRAAIDDIFQDTFLKVHRYRHKYDSSQPFVPWLFIICRSAMVDSLRKEMREPIVSLDSSIFSEVAVTESMPTELHAHFTKLSKREKTVLSLHYLNDLSFAEVANRLNLSAANARKVSSRAIKKLRSFWNKKP